MRYQEFPVGGGKITVTQETTNGVYGMVRMGWQGKSKSPAFWHKFNAARKLAIEWGKRKGQVAAQESQRVER